MTRRPPLHTLVTLREREVDRLSADVAAQRVTRERYTRNLERMTRLCEDSHTSTQPSPIQALNTGNFKVAVMAMAEQHRQDLVLHDARLRQTEQALQDAARRQEVYEQLLARQGRRLLALKASQEQKHQDDLATQVWLRGEQA
ncbi:MAG TPA: flagellar export protein FliJ [Aquabacterium sp.]|nr:flagellar export protein FliJ [Aquabacterium sp.]